MPDRDDLIIRWELGQTDANDELALAELLRDPVARRVFARNARVAAALGAPATVSATPLPAPAFVSGTTRQRKAFRIRPARSTRGPQWAIAASVALIVSVVALLMLTQQKPITAPTPPIARTTTPAQPPAPTPFARLIDGAGVHLRTLTGLHRDGHAGDALNPGDSIESADNAATVVLGNDVARLDLAPHSIVTLPDNIRDPFTSAVRLELRRGRVTANVAPRNFGKSFVISSSLAEVSVIGTRFTFGVDLHEAHLAVDHGSVRFSTPTDAGVLVEAGRSALASEGLISINPPAPDADQPLPAGARELWRVTTDNPKDWRGVVDASLSGTPAWRSVAPRDGDPWSRAELRSPVTRSGWAVESGTWLRFRYHVERFSPGLSLQVHFKPGDETNYAQRIDTDTSAGWHQALLRVDGAFRHLGPEHQPLAIGEQIHGAVWCAMRDGDVEATAARFWIRDVVVFTTP